MSGYDLRELWVEYEKVAMHFNDLLMRLRTQSLAGLVAVATAGSILVNAHSLPANQSLHLRILFASLALVWSAIAVIDLTYYDRMLLGAVGAIHELERKSETTERADRINLSMAITDAVTHKKMTISVSPWYTGRKLYYILIGGGLSAFSVAFAIASIC
jgi:hypothetical protein